MSNSIDTNSLLAQLRVMAARSALPESTATPEIDQVQSGEFGAALKSSLEGINDRQLSAARLAAAFERGEEGVELSHVLVEMQKARISFETLSQVRNKMISAYKDVMNMPL